MPSKYCTARAAWSATARESGPTGGSSCPAFPDGKGNPLQLSVGAMIYIAQPYARIHRPSTPDPSMDWLVQAPRSVS
jgi:hypothetical protein